MSDETDDMCPNCQTPWKCNGPHLIDETPRSIRSALLVARITARAIGDVAEYNRRREMLLSWLGDDDPAIMDAVKEMAAKARISFDDALRHVQSISRSYSPEPVSPVPPSQDEP